MKYSVIDISSSNISMIVAEMNERFTEIVFRDRSSLTLLHYLDGRALSSRGIDKVVEAVADMKDKCVSLGVDVLYLISTAALRSIDNFEAVGAAVLNRTGVPLNAIDGQREAYCDYIANRFYNAYERAVLLDIGGASIELCDLSEKGGDTVRSLDFGVLTLHQKFVDKIQPDAEEAKRIKKYAVRKLDKAGVPGEGKYATVVLVGTVALALYDLYAEYAGADRETGERSMDYKKFKKLADHLLNGRDRSKLILDVAPEKLYSVGIAAVVAKTVFRRFGAENIVVSDRGVKEGYLQLVTAGQEQGAFYDFAKEEPIILPAQATAATSGEPAAAGGTTSKPAAKARGAQGGKPAAKSGARSKKANGRAAAKQGKTRPAKTEEKVVKSAKSKSKNKEKSQS